MGTKFSRANRYTNEFKDFVVFVLKCFCVFVLKCFCVFSQKFFGQFETRILPPQQIGMILRVFCRSGDELTRPIKPLPHTRLRGTSVIGLRASPVVLAAPPRGCIRLA